MSQPDWQSLLQGFSQDPLGGIGQGLSALGQSAWQYTPQVASQLGQYAGQALNTIYPGAGVPATAAQAGYYGLTSPGQNLMGNQAQQPPQQQAQQPPQTYNYGTNAGPNAYGYGSAPTAPGQAAGTARAGGTLGGAGGGQVPPYTPGSTGAFGGPGPQQPNAPLGTGYGAPSYIDPANAYKDPGNAVTQALLELGINPVRGGPGVATVLSQAPDLVNSLLINAVNTGNDLLATPNGFADALRATVKRALAGGNVFYGPQAGAAALAQAQNLLSSMGQGPGVSQLGSALATDLLSGNTAANTIQSLLYAGGNPAARQAVSGWTQLIPLIMQQMLSANPAALNTAGPGGNMPTALDLMPQILNWKYQPPGSNLGPAATAPLTGQ